mgnify:FL=1
MKKQKVHDKNFEIYLEKHLIKERVSILSKEVHHAMNGRIPHFIAVLDGAFVFASDLLRAYPSPCKISFVKLNSYEGLSSSGEVHELIGLKEVPENECLIVLEDIVDTGATLKKIDEIFKKKEWYIATLFFKPKAYKGSRHIDFVGFEISNDFIVGYGLDYDGFGRNLKNVYQLAKA